MMMSLIVKIALLACSLPPDRSLVLSAERVSSLRVLGKVRVQYA